MSRNLYSRQTVQTFPEIKDKTFLFFHWSTSLIQFPGESHEQTFILLKSLRIKETKDQQSRAEFQFELYGLNLFVWISST